MAVYVPTLSKSAWAKSPEEKIDYLLSDFFTSEYSQSTLCEGSISSLTYLIQRYQGNVPSLIEMTRDTLNNYLTSYFDEVLVDVTSDAGTPQNPSNLVSLSIYIKITQDGVDYNAARLLEITDNKLSKIIILNNEGVIR